MHHAGRARAGSGWVLALVAGLVACRSDVGSPDGGTPERAGSLERTRIGAIAWYVDYDAAVEVAREEDKALWVHFGEHPG